MARSTRVAMGTAAAGLIALAARAGRDIPAEIGGRATGDRLARMRRSPHYAGGQFHNSDTVVSGGIDGTPAEQRQGLRRIVTERDARRPPVPIPVLDTGARLPTEGLAMSWLGHAGVLLGFDGEHVLFDPAWSDRCSPSQQVGPRRLHPVPFALSELPRLAAVVISHDHYDHLDMATIRSLAASQACSFIAPLGVGAHLERWGVPADRIVELDWDEQHEIGSLTVAAVESQHFSGRGVRRNDTLWASWVVRGPAGRVYFSGDTGYFAGIRAIGAEHGPFDLALMAIGAYDPAWQAIHLDPEEAVAAAADLRAALLVPIHWATWNLAPHPWAEPVERLLLAAERAGQAVAVPRVGESLRVAEPGTVVPWWRPA